jgi:hypothetical protein
MGPGCHDRVTSPWKIGLGKLKLRVVGQEP